ncbi:MAG: tetratricopeptide repeat protein [Candidatus Latescibacteria bacterium]|nr:tetratricopeptide repeat protein [Candidatus Latescibacterota bacterium]
MTTRSDHQGYIGKTLGHYTLTDLIGRGGMGTVYKAYDLVLERAVALKVLPEQFASDEEYIARFYREARAAAKLVHPNVVTVHDVGTESGIAYIVMEYVEGRTLKQELLHRSSALPTVEILDIAPQVMKALDLAHRRQILHRDIKSENIMLTPDGGVKVLDFGIARIVDAISLTKIGEIMGTVEYMSPEQALGEEMDVRSDLYSFGIVLYEMLTGELPFTGDSFITIIYQHINDPPVSPLVVNNQADARLAAMVMKTLAKEPKDRYQIVTDLLSDLEDYRSRQWRGAPALAPEPAPAPEEAVWEEVEEIRPVDILTPFRASAKGFYCDLVGREQEITTLQTAFDRAAAGQGRVLFLSGEAGVGKTRLASELQAYALAHGAWVLTGACFYRDTPIPYSPFVEVLQGFFRQTRRSRERQAHDRIKQFIEYEAPELKGLVPFIGTVISHGSQPPAESQFVLSTDVAQHRFFEVVTRVLEEIARIKPLVLLLDDLHWADTASFQLLHAVARSIRELPILILVTYRHEDLDVEDDEQVHPLTELMRRMNREDLFEKIEIPRLGVDDIVRMLDRILKRSSLSEALWELIFQETEGNPFFIIEVLKLLRDEGVIVEQDGMWEMTRPVSRLEIPGRVYDVIIRRLDRLEKDQRELLQVAAVEGERFTSNVLARALDLNRIKLLRVLHHLERVHQLVVPVDGKYKFDHTKIREILYNEISQELRQEYHLIIADCLEQEHQDHMEPAVNDLATHLYLGGDVKRAIPYLLQAGSNTARLFAFREAARYFDQALDAMTRSHSTDDSAWANLMLQTGQVYYNLGDWTKALERFEATLSTKETAVTDPAMKAEALLQIGRIKRRQGEWQAALDCYRQSFSLFEAVQDLRGIALVYQNSGDVCFEQGDWDQAQTYYVKGLEIAEQIDDSNLSAGLHTSMGVVASSKGEPKAAIDHYEASIQQYELIGDSYGLAKVYNNLGMAYEASQNWEEALAYYSKALTLCRKMGSTALLTLVYLNSAKMAVQLRELEKAEDSCRRALDLVTELGDQLGIAEAYKIYGMLSVIQEAWPEAESFLQQSKAMFEAHDNPLGVAEVCREMGVMFAKRGDQAQARQYLEHAKTLFHSINARGDVEEVEQQLATLIPSS